MMSMIFAAADEAQAEAEYAVFSDGRTVSFRTDGEMVDYFSYRKADDDLVPFIDSFSVSRDDGRRMYVIYAAFDDAI